MLVHMLVQCNRTSVIQTHVRYQRSVLAASSYAMQDRWNK